MRKLKPRSGTTLANTLAYRSAKQLNTIKAAPTHLKGRMTKGINMATRMYRSLTMGSSFCTNVSASTYKLKARAMATNQNQSSFSKASSPSYICTKRFGKLTKIRKAMITVATLSGKSTTSSSKKDESQTGTPCAMR